MYIRISVTLRMKHAVTKNDMCVYIYIYTHTHTNPSLCEVWPQVIMSCARCRSGWLQPFGRLTSGSKLKCHRLSCFALQNSKLPGEAVIELSVQPYTQKASDVVQSLPGEPLWQIQVKHDSRASVTSRILASFGSFLTHLHATDPNMPDSLQSLRSQGIILVITDVDDPDSIGWVPWRIAMYAFGM